MVIHASHSVIFPSGALNRAYCEFSFPWLSLGAPVARLSHSCILLLIASDIPYPPPHVLSATPVPGALRHLFSQLLWQLHSGGYRPTMPCFPPQLNTAWLPLSTFLVASKVWDVVESDLVSGYVQFESVGESMFCEWNLAQGEMQASWWILPSIETQPTGLRRWLQEMEQRVVLVYRLWPTQGPSFLVILPLCLESTSWHLSFNEVIEYKLLPQALPRYN